MLIEGMELEHKSLEPLAGANFKKLPICMLTVMSWKKNNNAQLKDFLEKSLI